MAAIILPNRWGQFPNKPQELNENNWLVQRGIKLYMPLGGYNYHIYGTQKVTTSDGLARVPDPSIPGGGIVAVADGSALIAFDFEQTRPWSCAIWGKSSASNTSQRVLWQRTSGTIYEGLRWSGNTAGDPLQALSSTSVANTSTGYTANKWHHGVAVFASASSRAAYIDGGSKGTHVTGVTQTWVTTEIGGPFTGNIAHALILPYALTDEDVLRLYTEQRENPYGLLRPRKRILYFSVSSGGRTGTMAATESGSDTASISGDVLVKGALAATESGADSAAIAGKVLVGGALSVSESGADTAALAGDVLVRGALAASETGNDSASFIGEGFVPTATGTLAASESGSDTASIAGKVYIAGTLSAVEGGLDGFAASGNILVQGTLAASETGDDTAAFVQETLTLTPADLNAIAAAVWADPAAVAAHAKLDEIIARITC